jgi:ferric-dicitrate binding protein FerR (iron transport regulator)
MPVPAVVLNAALAFLLLLITCQSAVSQQDCVTSGLSNPNRKLIDCSDTLVLELESGADVKIIERQDSAPPKAIILENGAIFIEVQPGSRPTQIRTPHAIAAVRGTTYVVDAGATRTSVFVVKGAVTVTKPNNASSVTLGPGDGVDVDPMSQLTVNRWSADRVSKLLARFGR